MIEQVVRFVVHKIQVGGGSRGQRDRPRTQSSEVLVLPIIILVAALVYYFGF